MYVCIYMSLSLSLSLSLAPALAPHALRTDRHPWPPWSGRRAC